MQEETKGDFTMNQKAQIILNSFRQISKLVADYEEAVDKEREYEQWKMKKEQLERQLENMVPQIISMGQQFERMREQEMRPPTPPNRPDVRPPVPNPNNWPICPETGLPYDPRTR